MSLMFVEQSEGDNFSGKQSWQIHCLSQGKLEQNYVRQELSQPQIQRQLSLTTNK